MSGIGSQAAKRKGHRLFSMSIVAIAAGALLGAGAARDAGAQGLTINIVDVAGNLALTQDAFELYARTGQGREFVFTKGRRRASEAEGDASRRVRTSTSCHGRGFANPSSRGCWCLLPDHCRRSFRT
jgi:hypothetical protein